jgi:endonuclease/exonuclease/phosphatase family metal-dependent hydrolase
LGLPENNVFPFVITGDFNARPGSSAGSIFAYETKIQDDLEGEAFWNMPEEFDIEKKGFML